MSQQQRQQTAITGPKPTAPVPMPTGGGGLYPSLDDYMGLNITHYNPVSISTHKDSYDKIIIMYINK